MRYLTILVFLISCNQNSLSEEQRKIISESQRLTTPVKISQAEILAKAFEEARRDFRDSSATIYQWKTFYVKPGDSVLMDLWIAYEYAAENNVKASDNIQMEGEMIYYTKPVIKNDTLKRMFVGFIPRKDIVLKLTP